LSNDTFKSRIADMGCDIKSQLIENIKASLVFGRQLDESVDSENFSQLRLFVLYIHNKTIEEDFCRPWETTTNASDVLKLFEDFFAADKLDGNKRRSVCTGGGPAMHGVRSSFLTLVKQKNRNALQYSSRSVGIKNYVTTSGVRRKFPRGWQSFVTIV